MTLAIRFSIGFYALVALAALVLSACGGGDDRSTATPRASVAASPTSPPATVRAEPCSGGLNVGLGPVAIVGRVVEVTLPLPGTEPGFESMLVTVRIDDSAFGPMESDDEGLQPMFLLGFSDVILLGDLITEVDVGDCVSVAGQEQTWACGPDCEDMGFVASFFEVLEVPSR